MVRTMEMSNPPADVKTYRGYRDRQGVAKVKKRSDGKWRALRLRLDLANHSPTGFEWGYAGSGPAQLALALLADAVGDDHRAVEWHQPFKFAVVGKLPRDGFTLTDRQVLDAIAELETRRK